MLVGPRHSNSKNINMWDLNVGVTINIYGKSFKIVDCDEFTRKFLSYQGITVPSQIPVPKRLKTKIDISKRNLHSYLFYLS